MLIDFDRNCVQCLGLISHTVRLKLLIYLKRLLKDMNFKFKGKHSHRSISICQ